MNRRLIDTVVRIMIGFGTFFVSELLIVYLGSSFHLDDVVSSLQEKQRAKTKEKIDKCVKEKLLDFCDLLDIPVSKATIKKVCKRW